MLRVVERGLALLTLSVVLRTYAREGRVGVFRLLITAIRSLPFVNSVISAVLKKEVTSAVKTMTVASPAASASGASAAGPPTQYKIPEVGIPPDQLLAEMQPMRSKIMEDGQLFAYVYNPGDGINDVSLESFMAFSDRGFDPKIDGVVRESFHSFMHENALNPTIFPALKQFEIEVVSMGAHMLHGDAYTSGSLTSGGTESILMAVKTHRDRARHLWPHITHPEIVMPITGHPAFEKAAHYLSLTIVHVPLAPDFGVDVEAFERAITPNTILLVGSAPQYCHGVIDPIERLSEIAISRNLPLHVDACFGGFMLPWIEKLGYSIPKWDFRVPGVTSISADIHKYGYGLKGSSLILYRHANIRKFQFFAYSEWPGGLFVSPSMTGSRPGGNIASSWAVMRAMGESGYIDLAKQLMNVTEKIKAAVTSHPDLAILGNPHMTALSIVSRNPDVDILAVSDVVEKEGGWRVERQQKPSSLHFSVIPGLIPVVDKFVEDLLKAVEKVKADKTLAKKGTAAMYGMIGAIPDTEILSDFLVEFFSQVYTAPSS